MRRSILSTPLLLLFTACAGAAVGGPDAERVYEAEAVTTQPQILNPAEVQAAVVEMYPRRLRAGGVGGRVWLLLTVGADGGVEARIRDSSGVPALDHAAMRVAERMRFAPGRIGDSPVPTRVPFPVTFTAVPGPPD